jgi:hypothetical protein
VRALSLPAAKGIDFIDDDGSIFEENIERMAAAGITRGCNPPVNNRFCPNANVTRGQMAAFLHRALGNRLHVKTYLTSIEPVTSYPGLSHSYVKEGKDEIDGRVYTRSLRFVQNAGKFGYREYNLSRDYSTFCSVIGVSDLTDTDASFEVEAFVDGVSKYVDTVTLGEAIGVRVPVAGGLRLKLEVRSTGPRSATFVWGDPYLQDGGECTVPGGSPTPSPPPETYLTSIVPVKSYPGLSHSYVKEGNAEIDGRVYTRSLQFVQSSGKLGYREYNLSRDYSMFCSVVGVSDLSGPDASFAVEVFVDGVSKYAQSVSFGETIGVRVPVAGGLRLKLEVRSTGPRATLVWGGPYLATGSCR